MEKPSFHYTITVAHNYTIKGISKIQFNLNALSQCCREGEYKLKVNKQNELRF